MAARGNAVQTSQQTLEKQQFRYRKLVISVLVKDEVSPDDIEWEQQGDPSLANVWALISEGKQNDNKHFFMKGNLIFRKFLSEKVANGKLFSNLSYLKSFVI